ncbi:MAG: cadmium-translocating P-type ATPase [Candidatus Omnitrophica bacterium]|nr:cadmium-translocating P-type ATPase [Candidatus Omnitrophota bacterium]
MDAKDASLDRKHTAIAIATLAALAAYVILRWILRSSAALYDAPLLGILLLGGAPLLYDIAGGLLRREWGSDVLAALSILTAVILGEYVAGAIIVLMYSGGTALEGYAVTRASSVLRALSKRLPSVAHRKHNAQLLDVALADIAPGDTLVIFPHEITPVDGVVIEGHSVMDESYLTGEPFEMSKAPGATVISGAINGEAALTIRATKRAEDSRYAKIMQVMRASAQHQPRLRRLGDQLGAFYTPVALGIAIAAWALSGESSRFLAVLVIATPCPLLIAIPVAIIGAVSLCARHAIIVKKPVVLEQVATCETAIFDKTGTLTYGTPVLEDIMCAPGALRQEVLQWAASIERYSKHPLARAVLAAATKERLALQEASRIEEVPGLGPSGVVAGHHVRIMNRGSLTAEQRAAAGALPPPAGMECLVFLGDQFAALLRFRDQPRTEGRSFITHLGPRHALHRILVVSGDRESEVRHLAERVGIAEVYAEQSPEQKVELVRRETAAAKTLMVGDGINDAPALLAATVGIAMGQRSDITTEAAGVVIMDSSLIKIDQFFHISERMRRIALQSAVGGMGLSLIGMGFAAAGYIVPVAGALAQEAIDLLAILNALRASIPPKSLSDF